MRPDEMDFGVRVRSQSKTALVWQVGEAVVVSREQRQGTTHLNSKADYNRYKIHRLETKKTKSQWADK